MTKLLQLKMGWTSPSTSGSSPVPACPKPEMLPGHKMWAATRPPTAKTTHPLLHTQDLLKGMTAAHQEGLPKETNFKEDYPDRGSALHLNKIRGRIYTPAGLPARFGLRPCRHVK